MDTVHDVFQSTAQSNFLQMELRFPHFGGARKFKQDNGKCVCKLKNPDAKSKQTKKNKK